jgi:GDP-mannose 6-dehydrogenase
LAPGLISPGVNPEFLREGHAIADFENPPLTVFGCDDAKTGSLLRDLYSGLRNPIFALTPKEALMVKYASNAFHAAKVVFANEIAAACRAEQIDPVPVMAAFCRDTSLNISSRYLRPGFAFGGSCLPKDLRAILHSARHHDLDLPMIRSIVESNTLVIDRAVRTILATQKRKVGLVGLSFKPSTDDLRESPFVELAERLLGKGVELAIYDPNVLVTRLVGGNKAYIDDVLPHLSRLMLPTIEELADYSDLLVVGHRFSELPSVLSHDVSVFDLADLTLVTQRTNGDRQCRTQTAPLAAS